MREILFEVETEGERAALQGKAPPASGGVTPGKEERLSYFVSKRTLLLVCQHSALWSVHKGLAFP